MMHRLLLNGLPHDVWLRRKDGDYVLLHDREESLLRPVPRAVVAADGDVVHIHLDGTAYTVHFQDPLDRFAEEACGDRGSIARAPMPGSVIDVFVQPGEAVRIGTPLLVIESMKLQTTIKATHEGTIRQVHFKTGQSFGRDATLVTLAHPES